MEGKRRVIDLLYHTPDGVAEHIGTLWTQWDSARSGWEEQAEEVRRYVYSTDTTTTSNNQLPWKNKTTLPKLCQIRDNLHANYTAALFPNDKWFDWESSRDDGEDVEKIKAIKAYIAAKTRTSAFENTMHQLVLDFIDYGNAFADVQYVEEKYEDEEGIMKVSYSGPRVIRISPKDIVFDPTAPDFEGAPKIVRKNYTLGELEYMVNNAPETQGYLPEAIEHAKNDRLEIMSANQKDISDDVNLQIGGMGSALMYYNSGMVEVLEFEGDVYDTEKMEYMPRRLITVIDRRYVLRNIPMPTLHGRSTKSHVGWRLRPGNLMAMGPLDNLVGMQYRIDHLENLRADAFDMIAYPMLKIIGDVEDFEYRPSERVYIGDDGDVDFLHPDTTVLQSDTQIAILENRMEEMAGAPKQAMGFRTPGEKTAYEVQVLENGASRIFQNKINYFERNFLEPILNNMLEVARRNVTKETIKLFDEEASVNIFEVVTKDDLKAGGALRPVGARHFTEKAQAVQNLSNFANSALGQDQSVTVHFSGLKLAKAIEELLNLEQFNIVEENIRLKEQQKTTEMANSIQDTIQRKSMIDPELEDNEVEQE